MFCKNCGNEMDPSAAVCLKCGFAKDTGNKFCRNCGSEINEGAVICIKCGCPTTPAAPATSSKSKLAAGILGILLGVFGVHNFYLGYTGKAVAQLLITVLTCFAGSAISGIWGLIEGIMILCGNIDKDAAGNKLAD